MKDFVRLVRSWLNGSYREFPWRSFFILILLAVYAVNPFDIIPDLLPIIGVIDDAAMLGFLVRSLMKDLETFRAWEQAQVQQTQTALPPSARRSDENIVDAEFEDVKEEQKRLRTGG